RSEDVETVFADERLVWRVRRLNRKDRLARAEVRLVAVVRADHRVAEGRGNREVGEAGGIEIIAIRIEEVAARSEALRRIRSVRRGDRKRDALQTRCGN